MEPTELTIEILKGIYGEVRAVKESVGETNQRLDQTNQRLDRLEKHQVEAEVRIATEVVAVAQSVRGLRDVLLEDRQLLEQVHDHERRIRTLEQRP